MRYLSVLAVAGLLTSSAAGAVSFSFGTNTVSTQKQGGAVVSTDNFTSNGGGSLSVGNNFNNCSVNSGTGVDVSNVSGDDYRVSSSTAKGQRLNPFGSASAHCFLSAADPTQTLNGNASPQSTVDFTLGGGNSDPSGAVYDSYIGFYWGSVDDYNYIELQQADGTVVAHLTGTQVAAMAGIGVDTAANTFINIFLKPSELVTDLVIGNTTNYAFELTDLSVTGDPVDGQVGDTPPAIASPAFARSSLAIAEPGAAVSLLAGMGLLGFTRRKRG